MDDHELNKKQKLVYQSYHKHNDLIHQQDIEHNQAQLCMASSYTSKYFLLMLKSGALKEIESKRRDERDLMESIGPYSQAPQRVVKPKYHKDELPFDNVNAFYGPKEFGHNLYLTELLIESHVINNAFQHYYQGYFSFERFRIPCEFTPTVVQHMWTQKNEQ